MSDRWQEMTVFVRVADSGSLSRAARALKLSQPSVSRIIGTLEARLGTTLLLRTTRSISLTDAGALYLERARRLLSEMEEADQAARGVDSLHGLIRLAMPLMYGTRAIIPVLVPFLAQHPDLKVELVMSDARQNLVTDGVDLAIRITVGPLDDSSFGARKLALVERLVIAAPAYLSTRGTPATPGDLARHDCIVQHGSFGSESWRFKRSKTVTSVDVHPRLWINSAPGVLAATIAGLGISLGTRVMAGEELRTGQLTQLLDGYQLDPAEAYAVFPAGPRPSAKVRAIVDHLAASLGGYARRITSATAVPVTSATAVPVSACFSANAICSSVCLVFFMSQLPARRLQRAGKLSLSMDEKTGRTSTSGEEGDQPEEPSQHVVDRVH